jgi:hypothetical protein
MDDVTGGQLGYDLVAIDGSVIGKDFVKIGA